MPVLPAVSLHRRYTGVGLFLIGVMVAGGVRCTADFPATDTKRVTPPQSATPVSSTCPPTTATVGSTTTTPGSTTPVSTTPVSATQPTPAVDTLAVAPPRFVPNGGNLHVGTSVRIAADSLPPQAVVEYSVDGGQQWVIGQQFLLRDGGSLLSRIRLGTRTSRTRSTLFSVYFNRVLVIGNSIMSHAPDPSIGWNNFNGMAASAPEKDFVHILTQRLKALQPAVTVSLVSGGGFERNYVSDNLANLTEPLRLAPDLIIVRIAENVAEGDVDRLNFDAYYRALLSKVATSSVPIKVVCSTSFWNHPRTDAIIRKAAADSGIPVADLCKLVGRPDYLARQFANPGVAAHPNDAGMQQIADLLWDAIQ